MGRIKMEKSRVLGRVLQVQIDHLRIFFFYIQNRYCLHFEENSFWMIVSSVTTSMVADTSSLVTFPQINKTSDESVCKVELDFFKWCEH